MSEGTRAVWVFLAAWVAVHALLFLLLGTVGIIDLTGWSSSVTIFVLFVAQELLILGLLYGAWKRVAGLGWHDIYTRIGARRQRKGRGFVWSYVMGGLVVYFLLNAALLSVLTALGWELPGLYGEQMVMTMISAVDMQLWWEFILVGMIVVCIGPVVEELVFRVFVTHELMTQRGGRGVVLAAVLFALVHAERAVVRNLFLVSLFLCYVYRKTGSARYSFLFHLGINGLAFAVLILMQVHPELVM